MTSVEETLLPHPQALNTQVQVAAADQAHLVRNLVQVALSRVQVLVNLAQVALVRNLAQVAQNLAQVVQNLAQVALAQNLVLVVPSLVQVLVHQSLALAQANLVQVLAYYVNVLLMQLVQVPQLLMMNMMRPDSIMVKQCILVVLITIGYGGVVLNGYLVQALVIVKEAGTITTMEIPTLGVVHGLLVTLVVLQCLLLQSVYNLIILFSGGISYKFDAPKI